jgi:outer membrane immunogenic protein
MTRFSQIIAGFGALFTMTAPAVAQDWTGSYAGVQFGTVVTSDEGIFSLSPLPAGGALATAFSPSPAVPDAGFFGEAASGNIAGLHYGYDWQSGSMVYGAVASIFSTDINDKQQGKSRTPAVYTVERSLDTYATLGGRVGYLVQPATLIYGTAGLAMGQVDFAYSQPGSGAATTTSGGQDSEIGYAVGFGVENRVTERVSIGVEYSYVNLGGNDYTANLRNGPFSAAAPSTNAMGSDGDFDFGTIQLKVSYRF